MKFVMLRPEARLNQAIKIFQNTVKAIVITDKDKKLMGILTRRDIHLLSANEIAEKTVLDVCTSERLVVAPENISREKLIKILKTYKLKIIPVVNRQMQVVNVISISDVLRQKTFCLMLMPYKSPYIRIFNQHIKKNLEQDFEIEVSKADDIFNTEPIIDTIQYLIAKADFLIADISERNPNVYYEIGYAHAIHKKIIFITHKTENIPFDIAHLRCITYKKTAAGMKKLVHDINKIAKEIITKTSHQTKQ